MEYNKQVFNRLLPALLLICFIVGLYFRLSGLSSSVWSNVGYDETRDTLVASHMALFNERLTRGPHAANQYLLYPPTYYYFLSLLWQIVRGIYGIKFVWMMLSLGIIPIAYKLGEKVWDKRLGLLFAVLVTIHPVFILIGQQVTPPYLLPLVVSLSALCLLLRPIRAYTLAFAIGLLFLGLHIHYSTLLVVPVMFVWWIWTYQQYVRLHMSWKRWIPSLVGVASFSSWLLLSYRRVPFDQIDFITKNPMAANIFSKFTEVIGTWGFLLLYEDMSFVAAACLLLIVYGTSFFIVFSGRHNVGINKKAYILTFLLNVVPLVMASRYPGEMSTGYLMVILPFGLLFIAFILRLLFMRSKAVGIVCACALIGVLGVKSYQMNNPTSPFLYYRHMENIALEITKDYRLREETTEETSFTVMFLSPRSDQVLDDWQTGGIWFHLERILGTRLVKLTESGVNFVPLIENPKYLYVICDERLTQSLPDDTNTCSLLVARVIDKLPINWRLIYDAQPYTVWRFVRR